MKNKHTLLKRSRIRVSKNKKPRSLVFKKQDVNTLLKKMTVEYSEVFSKSDQDFIYETLQENFSKFGKIRPLLRPYLPFVENENIMRVKFEYLHQKNIFSFRYNSLLASPITKDSGNAIKVNYTVGKLDSSEKRKIFQNILINEINKTMKGIRAEYYVLQVLKDLVKGTPFTLEHNADLDNLEIDAFLRYRNSKIGIAFQVKSSRKRERNNFVPSTLQQKNPYITERIHNNLEYLFIKKREDAVEYIPHIKNLMNDLHISYENVA